MNESGPNEDAASEAANIALEIAHEDPVIRPSLAQAEVLKALKEVGSIEDRDSIETV